MACTVARVIPLLALCLIAGLSGQREPADRPAPVRMPPAAVPISAAAEGAVKNRLPRASASSYHDIVERAARRHRVNARLLHAIIAVESAYRADAVSQRGAMGLMQLMPATAERYGLTDLLDPAQNVHAGAQHLRELLEFFDGNVMLALAAYNAGAGAVLRHGGIPPYRETAQYVAKVLERYAEYGGLPSR